MSLEDNIRNTFRNKDLDDESWLDLDDGFFDQIEEQLPEEKEEKKRRYFIFWFSGVLLLAGLMTFCLKKPSASQITEYHPVQSVDREQSAALNGSSTVKKSSSRRDQIADAVLPSDDPSMLHSTTNEAPKSNANPRPAKHKHRSTPQVETADAPRLASPTQAVAAGTTKEHSPPIKPDTKTLASALLSENQEERPAEEINSLSRDESLPLLDHQRQSVMPPAIQLVEEKPSAALGLELGFVGGHFTYNENILKALEPAAYADTDMSGLEARLYFALPLNAKWNVNFAIDYSRLHFTSGHNSEALYQLDRETDQQNWVDLTMASPFGFVESQVLINRSEASTSDRPLTLDLHNAHRLQQLGLSAGLERAIGLAPRWTAYPRVGVKYIRTLSAHTDLDRFGIAEAGYQSVRQQITQQASVAQHRLATDLGLRIGYQFTDQLMIHVSGHYQYDFTQLYSVGDYQVRPQLYGIALGLRVGL